MSSAYLRMAVAAAATAVAICLAGFPMLRGGRLTPLVDILGAAALLSLLLPLLWRSRGTWLLLFLLGSEYAIVESSGHAAAVSVLAYATGLIVLCELLFWLAELPAAASVDLAAIRGRLLALTLIGGAAASLALVTLLATSVRLSSAFGAVLLGALAAAALLTIPLLLLRQRA